MNEVKNDESQCSDLLCVIDKIKVNTMDDFEEWWEGFAGLVALKMSIYLDVYEMDNFYKYFEKGLTQSEAMQKHYIG